MEPPGPDTFDFPNNPLLCPICHDYFAEPCILSCYHTFCSRCLRGRELDRKLVCPCCRQPTILRDASTLPTPDTLMRQLIDIANSENPPCSNCDKRDRASMYYCNTCGQALCSSCRDNTHRAKMFSAHEVVHMSKCTKEPKRCPQHGEQYIMYSPIQHSMLCVNCFRDTPNEIRAQCLDIDTAHTQAAKRLERGQNAIMDLQTSVRDGILALKGLMDELRRNMDSEKHTINTFCQGMQEAMAKTHAAMIMEVQRQYESKDRIYRSQLLLLGSVMPVLQLHLVLCTTFTSAANKYQFLELCPSLIERLSAVGQLSQPVSVLQDVRGRPPADEETAQPAQNQGPRGRELLRLALQVLRVADQGAEPAVQHRQGEGQRTAQGHNCHKEGAEPAAREPVRAPDEGVRRPGVEPRDAAAGARQDGDHLRRRVGGAAVEDQGRAGGLLVPEGRRHDAQERAEAPQQRRRATGALHQEPDAGAERTGRRTSFTFTIVIRSYRRNTPIGAEPRENPAFEEQSAGAAPRQGPAKLQCGPPRKGTEQIGRTDRQTGRAEGEEVVAATAEHGEARDADQGEAAGHHVQAPEPAAAATAAAAAATLVEIGHGDREEADEGRPKAEQDRSGADREARREEDRLQEDREELRPDKLVQQARAVEEVGRRVPEDPGHDEGAGPRRGPVHPGKPQVQEQGEADAEAPQAEGLPVQRRRGQRLLFGERFRRFDEHLEPQVLVREPRQDAGGRDQPEEQEPDAGAEAAELGDVPPEAQAPRLSETVGAGADAPEEDRQLRGPRGGRQEPGGRRPGDEAQTEGQLIDDRMIDDDPDGRLQIGSRNSLQSRARSRN